MDRGWDRWRAGWRLVLTIGAIALILSLASSAVANTFKVTRADDPAPGRCNKGDCSLREAANAAHQHGGADAIKFAERLSGQTILLAGDSVEIGGRLTIEGLGHRHLTISANDQSRVLHMTGGRVEIRRVTIAAGREVASPAGAKCPGSSASGYELGGGILQEKGDLSLDRLKLADNTVQGPANTIIGGGGVAMLDGSLSVTHSNLTDNALDGGSITEGGGIFSCDGVVRVEQTSIAHSIVSSHAIADGGGYAILREGKATIDRSTLTENSVFSEAIAEGAGGFTAGAPVTIKRSTISSNLATAPGSGDIAEAAGFLNANARSVIVNSTIAYNGATGAIADGGGIITGGTGDKLILKSSTLVGNRANGTTSSVGGNLLGSSSAKLLNTIVAKGKATQGANCDAPVKSSGHDLEDKDTCGFNAQGDRVNKDPQLKTLKDNGGPTETIALKRQSPAIDHAAKKSSPNRDQRGFKRVGRPDIGAYEFGAKR